MLGTVLYGRRDVRFEAPNIHGATCVCRSDLWDYRGINKVTDRKPMDHEYCGVVEKVGSAVPTD